MAREHVVGFDHVSLPMQHTDEMVAFYRALGFDVAARAAVVSVYAGAQMVNFHRPELWPRAGFTLRAPAAVPPCGDLCFVWEGTADALPAYLERAGAVIEEGPSRARAVAAHRRRACTYATPTATSWSS